MMRGNRIELLILITLGVVLIVATALSAEQQRSEEDELYGSTYSSGEGGARALYLWLDDLGYEVQRLRRGHFDLRPEDGVLWIIAPPFGRDPSESDVEEIEAWVRDGGILVWADSLPHQMLFDAFDVESEWSTPASPLRPTTPWIRHSEAQYEPASVGFDPLPPGAIPLLADEQGRVSALRLRAGQGEVWLFGILQPFTNLGLKDERHSALIAGLLEKLPSSTRMTFDEIHHGFSEGASERTLLSEMRRAPWGWAIYYAVAVVALWILLRGRSFGRPLPLPGEHLRREAGEYVQSMAWLYRRARQRAPILRYHHDRLKRRVTQRHRLPALVNDDAFVSALARVRSDINQEALHRHLRALRQQHVSETELLALAHANDEWLETLLS
ncbi:MAG: DUF4350 domain-containing protein [Ardenticatenaceae bacterium]